jgi:VWFA-related protein
MTAVLLFLLCLVPVSAAAQEPLAAPTPAADTAVPAPAGAGAPSDVPAAAAPAETPASGDAATLSSTADGAVPVEPAAALRITSPLGRTGVVTRLRIVAQADLPYGDVLSPVAFYVDGQHVGTVEPAAGPPYSVEWVDKNPFEKSEIVVQATDSKGRPVKDTVVLPPFEVVDVTEVTSILLETSVYDKDGNFVSDFDQAAFRVLENGVEQVVDLVAREATPTTMVLLVDNSQSMHRRMDFLRRAAGQFVERLRPQDAVIVAPFNARVGTITGPSRDPGTIVDAIRQMRAEGGTAILDALKDGLALLAGVEGRRAVVLLTDGYDENSASPADEVLRLASSVQATVYVVGIGGVAGISLKGERMLRQIAERTGGRVFFPPREMDLPVVADHVSTDTKSRYLVTYTPSNQRTDGTWREITVEVPEGYKVRTRPGYFAPAPPPIRPTIEFTVTDEHRQFVDVTMGDLEVVEDGIAQMVDTFQEAVDPVSIVMALDSSGSMRRSAELVKQTARDFVLAVRPEDKLATIMFADQAKFAHGLGTNRQNSLDAIDKYVALGGTALYDALWNSLMTLKGVAGRRAVVVLTDGRDENNPGTAPGSVHKFEEVLALSRDVGATIFTIALGTNLDRAVLDMLAATSGGASYFAADTSTLGEQFQRVVENLRRRYVLSYVSTNSTHDGEWRKVEVRSITPGHSVSTLGGYFAPTDEKVVRNPPEKPVATPWVNSGF